MEFGSCSNVLKIRESYFGPAFEQGLFVGLFQDVVALQRIYDQVMAEGGFPSYEEYVGKPHPVDAPAKDRMKENWAGREGPLCIYDEQLRYV